MQPSDILSSSDQDSLELEEIEDNFMDYQNSPCYLINSFLENIKSKITLNISLQGDRLNGYYLPAFNKNLLRICKQFPLWSNVMIHIFKSPYYTATSASVEGDFSELKNKI